MAAQERKYSALPDLDEAPDIYETPELTDDTSTLQTSTAARSRSPSASETSDAEPSSGVSRHRLRPNAARSQFQSSRIDARDADFSDRVHTRRRAYRVSNRRARSGALVEGNEDTGEDWNSEDEDEGLDRRLARLIREAQEVQAELEKRKTAGGASMESQDAGKDSGDGQDLDVSTKFRELNAALEKIRVSQTEAGSAHAKLVKQLASNLTEQNEPPAEIEPIGSAQSTTITPSTPDAATVSKIADFDARLASLERALGTSILDTPATFSTPFTPVLPTLSLLDRQVTLLSSVPSQPHLDSMIQKLHQAQTSTPANPSATAHDDTATSTLSAEDMAKLRSLYSLLPQLTALAPTLPPLLARLRSLRTLHAGAAVASQTLDEIERKQDEADREIKEWTAGLTKVTEAVRNAEGGMRENVGALDGWVKDLEERVKQLG